MFSSVEEDEVNETAPEDSEGINEDTNDKTSLEDSQDIDEDANDGRKFWKTSFELPYSLATKLRNVNNVNSQSKKGFKNLAT